MYYRLRTDFEAIQTREEEANDGVLKITSAMFRTVFIEIKRNIPFNSHSSIVALQNINGIDMGFHLYEKCGATSMMESMSSLMHKAMINHIMSKNLPFSIIIDGSTDATESHMLIIYFQILENNVPVVCFYRLLETSSDRTAAGLFKTIKDAMISEENDLFSYFKRNLVGYASDGERVMSGHLGGLISIIRRNTEKPIYAIHCMAHRLHLAIHKAFESNSYFKEFDSFINKLFQFYNWNGSKRKSHLKETADRFKMKAYELNYIYKERWISSELQSVTNLRKMWSLLIKDLELISVDNKFDMNSRSKAKNLLIKLKGKNFLVIFNFVSDVLHHLSYWSLRMQERTALLVDFTKFDEKIIKTFQNLKTDNGKDLTIFLEKSVCGNDDSQKCKTVDNYESHEHVTYAEVQLIIDINSGVPYLSEIRNSFLDSIIQEIKSYFPSSDLALFHVFYPSNIPTEESLSITYGVKEINEFCEIFGMSECNKLLNEWAKLLESIILHEKFCTMRNDKTETFAFWSFFLNEIGVHWTDRTTRLIQTILVLPIGSADAERGFSVMNHIKSPRRSTITNAHMEDMMRIRLNGVDEIEKFPATKYAHKWIKQNHIRTDDPRKTHAKSRTLLTEEDAKKKHLPKLSFL